jgi:hypothetical protein
MSYDLHLLRKEEVGDDPAAAYGRLEEREERTPTPEEQERLRRLAADLQAASPGLDLSEAGQGFLLQLGYDGERAVVIDIGAGEITMSLSYGADDASAALEEVRRYLPVFDRYGYVAYDPQLERLFDPERDAGQAAAVHRDTHRQLEQAYGPLSDQRRPWWKRLLGRP